MMALESVSRLLDEIRQVEHLQDVREDDSLRSRYEITGPQLNFLLAVVAVERYNLKSNSE